MILKSIELENELNKFDNNLKLSQLIIVKNYIKTFKKIEKIKSNQYQMQTVLNISELFFLNELVSNYLLIKLQNCKSKEDIKIIIGYIKRETDIINAKIKLYKNNIYKFDSEKEINNTLKLYYDEFSARRIMKEIQSGYSNKNIKKEKCKIINFRKKAN